MVSSRFTLRGGFFDLSEVPNGTNLDSGFQQFQFDGKIEERHEIFGQPGKFKITGTPHDAGPETKGLRLEAVE